MFKILALLVAVVILGFSVKKGIELEQNCTGYLKRAADANSTEMAKNQLGIAIKYLEDNHTTHGYTSVFWRTPDEDIQFWYSNLKSCQEDLADSTKIVGVDSEKLTLLKLRQTLLDQSSSGDSITYPNGLTFYPFNLEWGIARAAAIIILLVLALLWYYKN